MQALKIPMDHSLAGKTRHNSLAERNNQFLLVATTTCMLEAGVPPCFWRYAITCVSHLLNIEPKDDEVSAWCKLHGEEFRGKMIPFGAMVYFKPSGAREIEQKHKFDPMGIPGVFAGYELGPCQQWSRFGHPVIGPNKAWDMMSRSPFQSSKPHTSPRGLN